jgi:hypothetical protein
VKSSKSLSFEDFWTWRFDARFRLLESELLSNESVGSALPVLDVIRCFLRFGFDIVPLPIVPWTKDGAPVAAGTHRKKP